MITEKSDSIQINGWRGFDRVSCYTFLSKYWGEIALKKAYVIIDDLYNDGLLEKE